ncbi:MAG: glycosyltransferase [SAR324 cluster bacterium]|nr:glycosyltransferase [SAR324 cluster bacterium]
MVSAFLSKAHPYLRRLGFLRRIARSPAGGRLLRTYLQFLPQHRGYQRWIAQRLRERERLYPARLEPGLLSLVTPVWNTRPEFLTVLLDSLLGQTAGLGFEWIVLDNGSTNPGTIAFLRRLGEHPFVRLSRVEQNLGIMGGMRRGLEQATGRYILPLDSDDFLYPDCLEIFAWHIKEHGHPPFLYSDEDILDGEVSVFPYSKPDWDPVLFLNSCYISHLCAIDRRLALDLGAYSDHAAHGSHDWDTFVRFLIAGHTPVHVPEIVYSWRMHAQSTAGGNIATKTFVYDSQRTVLNKFLASRPASGRYYLEQSPLFRFTPKGWVYLAVSIVTLHVLVRQN